MRRRPLAADGGMSQSRRAGAFWPRREPRRTTQYAIKYGARRVLDNCEHVIDAAARLAETVIRMCPPTTILATSREILNIEGEHVYRVPPLDVTPQHEEAANISAHSAVQLFIATARAARSDFSPHGDDLAVTPAICRA